MNSDNNQKNSAPTQNGGGQQKRNNKRRPYYNKKRHHNRDKAQQKPDEIKSPELELEEQTPDTQIDDVVILEGILPPRPGEE